jgi:hypothetical protein
LRLCRAQGANVNLKGDEGKTALFHACRRGKTAIVGVLLENGAQANAVDEEMKTVRPRTYMLQCVYAIQRKREKER